MVFIEDLPIVSMVVLDTQYPNSKFATLETTYPGINQDSQVTQGCHILINGNFLK